MDKEMLKKVKLEAQNEIDKEQFEKAKDKLKELYQRKAKAELMIKNIEREILDYEMELEGK